MEIFVQHQRRDVHAAGGSPGTDGDAQRDAHAQTGKDGVEHQIIGEHKICKHPLPQGQKQRAEDGAGNGGKGKAAAQYHPAQHQHADVDGKQHPGPRQAQHTVDPQRDAGGAAGDQPGRHQKQHDRQRVQCVARNDGQRAEGDLLLI